MAKRTYASDDRPVTIKTLTAIFLDAVDAYGERPAFGRILPSREVEYISYDETFARAKSIAGALEAWGLARGDRAAIMSINRLEWALADYGCLCAGVVDVPIYPTLTAPQGGYILRNSGASLLFVPDKAQLAKAREAIAECGHAVRVVVFDPPEELPEGVSSWADFME
ncbi:MAG: long-chain fatty acid--CoA ligase, partial [Gemmatimonadetes bacterium]|nr:long-chain fatty acid--CoA ligase [Gemmatimonadota bacterium]